MNTSETMMYEWKTLPWRRMRVAVFKLQKRIYQASRSGDVKAVHQLQRLLIKSRSSVLLAVRRVTQENQGKHTAGVDGLASLTDAQKLELAERILKNPLDPRAKPLRRVWIPKPNQTEMRPLGIPVVEDRARQALVKLALEPEWEAKFEPNSYGFRPGRSCQDAIEAIYRNVRLVPKFVLDADIAKCFDRINHQALLDKLGTFPRLRRVVKAWLKAGILDGEELFPTEEGTPQGGVISPLLANVALHGLETAVQAAFPRSKGLQRGGPYVDWQPTVIRYADDFVILHRDLDAIKHAQQVAAEWLKGMGLEMKPSKTRITHTMKEIDGNAGFEFLGFHIRQYPRGKCTCIYTRYGEPTGFTASIRPSKTSQKRLLRTIREILRANRSVSQVRLIRLLNPVIRGWGNHFSKVVSKEVFGRLDALIFQKLKAWAYFRHPNKGHRWIMAKYWSFREDRWVFGIRDRIKLIRLPEIPIRRHIGLREGKSPFDGDWVYWSERMGQYPDVPKSVAIRLKAQQGVCSDCGLHFVPGDEMAILHRDGDPRNFHRDNAVLVHKHCVATTKRRFCHVQEFAEEPDEGKLSRPVLKTSADREVRA